MAALSEQAFWELVTTPDLGLDPQSVSDHLRANLSNLDDQQLIAFDKFFGINTVSYTHLTLPTSDLV